MCEPLLSFAFVLKRGCTKSVFLKESALTKFPKSRVLLSFEFVDFASSHFVSHLVAVASRMISAAYAQPLTVDDYMDKLEPDNDTRERLLCKNIAWDTELMRVFFSLEGKESLAAEFETDLKALCSLEDIDVERLKAGQHQALLHRVRAICVLSHEITMCLYRLTPMSGAAECLDYLGLGENQSYLYEFKVHGSAEEIPADRTEVFAQRMSRLDEAASANIENTERLVSFFGDRNSGSPTSGACNAYLLPEVVTAGTLALAHECATLSHMSGDGARFHENPMVAPAEARLLFFGMMARKMSRCVLCCSIFHSFLLYCSRHTVFTVSHAYLRSS